VDAAAATADEIRRLGRRAAVVPADVWHAAGVTALVATGQTVAANGGLHFN
jgi:hypothetical protein